VRYIKLAIVSAFERTQILCTYLFAVFFISIMTSSVISPLNNYTVVY